MPWLNFNLCYTVSAHQVVNINITIDEQYCGSIGTDYPDVGENATVTCGEPFTGRKLVLQKTETLVLNLAEVQPIFVGPDGCSGN